MGQQNVLRRRSRRKNASRAHTAAGRTTLSLTFTQGEFYKPFGEHVSTLSANGMHVYKSRPYSQLLGEPKGG